MKKIVLILLTIIYSLSVVGLSLKEFYCCGKLKSVTVAFANDAKDKCGKGDSKDGCCNTKYAHFKVKDSHLVSAELATPEKLFIDLHTSTSALQSVALIAQEVDLINGSHAPPLHTGVPVYILNCVFRI